MTGGMKKLILCQVAWVVFLTCIVFFWSQTLMLFLAPFGVIPIYTKRGPVEIRSENKTILAGIYTRKGAPYVLVGPYPFPEQRDFFFVRFRSFSCRKCRIEVFDKVDDHFAVVVRKDFVAVVRKKNFEFVCVADVAVVCTDHVDEAVDFMRLRIDVCYCAVSRPADLTDEFESAVFCEFKLFDDF